MRNHRLSQVVWLIIILVASSCVSQTQLPDELLGTWKTEALKYQDTFFEMKTDLLVLGMKTGEVHSFTITKVEGKKLREEEWVLYTVFYQNDSLQKFEFPFYYKAAKNGVIRFKNQENLVWKKEIQ